MRQVLNGFEVCTFHLALSIGCLAAAGVGGLYATNATNVINALSFEFVLEVGTAG